MKVETAIVVAVDDKMGIGKNGEIPWGRIPEDLKHFIAETVPHPVIMGRVTFESIPEKNRPLKDRQNIVLTRQKLAIPGVMVVHSIEEALEEAQKIDHERISIIGGEQIYREALPFVDTLKLTRLPGNYDCDTFFPPFEDQFELKDVEICQTKSGINLAFQNWSRKKD